MADQGKKLTMASLEGIRKSLKDAPPPDPSRRVLTKAEAVTALKDDIQSLRGKGHTWEDIAELMAKNGMAITAPSLKNYMQRAGSTRSRRKTTKAKADTPAN